MQLFHDIYTQLYTLHQEWNRPGASAEAKTELMSELFLFLETHRQEHCPHAFTRQAIEFLQGHLDFVLPDLDYKPEDLQEVSADYQVLLTRLEASECCVRQLETELFRVFKALRDGQVPHEQAGATLLHDLARNFLRQDELFSPSMRRSFKKRTRDGLTRKQVFGLLEKVFGIFLKHTLDPAFLKPMTNFRQLCEYYAQAYFHGKAVLVNVARQGLVTPLWLWVDRAKRSEHVSFEQQDIDAVMQISADAARATACRYLKDVCDQEIDERLAVHCRFPLPAAGYRYRDSSASLLIGLQIVGDVLDLDPEAASVVSGELNECGHIVEVAWIPEKIKAVAADESIERFLIPAGNMPDSASGTGVSLTPVQSFPDALESYYGAALQRRLQQISRRKIVKGVVSLVAAPFVFTGLRSVFFRSPNPVGDCDWRLLESARELYQQDSNYRHAVTILESILIRFQREDSSRDAIRIQAFALGHLGVIHLQRQQMNESLRVLRQAARFWDKLVDRENQADILLRIGEVYRYKVAMGGSGENARRVCAIISRPMSCCAPPCCCIHAWRGDTMP